MNYTIILFYKYVQIDAVQQEKEAQLELCKKLNLTGRLIVAEEGINGTLEGADENISEYIAVMRSDKRFADIDFKTSPGNGEAFPRLSVKARPEIVASKLSTAVDPTKDTGTYLDPEELHQWYEDGKEFYVIDMRNGYEFNSGHFRNSINPEMRVFRELPEKIKDLEHLKDKTVVPVCTGGVRCEKASAFLKQQGFKDVYQLKGGMHRYIEKYPTGHYLGSLYVFDGRVTISTADEQDREIVGRCEFCEQPTENYIDDDTTIPSTQKLCCQACMAQKQLRPASLLVQV